MAELHRAGRRVSLAIAGDGEEGPALRAQVARLGLADSVRFLGHTPGAAGLRAAAACWSCRRARTPCPTS